MAFRLKDLIIAPTEEEKRAREQVKSSPASSHRASSPRQAAPSASQHSRSAPPPPTRSEPLLVGLSKPTSGGTAKSSVSSSRSVSKEPDQHFLSVLREVLEERVKTLGYHEFAETLDVVDDDITDVETALKVTLRTLKRVHGIDKEQVVRSVEECLAALEDERASIESRLADESRQQRDERQGALSNASNKVSRLEAELNKARAEEADAKRALDELSGMIENVRSRFESALSPMVEEFSRIRSNLR